METVILSIRSTLRQRCTLRFRGRISGSSRMGATAPSPEMGAPASSRQRQHSCAANGSMGSCYADYALLSGSVGNLLRGNLRLLRSQRYFAGSVYIGLGAVTALTGLSKKG